MAVYFYLGYIRAEKEKRARIEDRYALVTAQIWVASAKHRANPEEFLRVRDSLLEADSLTSDDLRAFVAADSGQAEKLTPFMSLVQQYVDSLMDVEDSLLLIREDSLKKAADAIR